MSLFQYLRAMGTNYGSVYKHKAKKNQSLADMYWADRLYLLCSIPCAIFPYILIFKTVSNHFVL